MQVQNIEIKSLSTILDDDVLRDYDYAMIEKNADNNSLLYSVGLFKSYRMAKELKDELISKGYTDAVIVAYKDGQRLETEADLKQFIDKFPDLQFMLNN